MPAVERVQEPHKADVRTDSADRRRRPTYVRIEAAAPKGDECGIAVVDITEHRRAEGALLELNEQLLRSSRVNAARLRYSQLCRNTFARRTPGGDTQRSGVGLRAVVSDSTTLLTTTRFI